MTLRIFFFVILILKNSLINSILFSNLTNEVIFIPLGDERITLAQLDHMDLPIKENTNIEIYIGMHLIFQIKCDALEYTILEDIESINLLDHNGKIARILKPITISNTEYIPPKSKIEKLVNTLLNKARKKSDIPCVSLETFSPASQRSHVEAIFHPSSLELTPQLDLTDNTVQTQEAVTGKEENQASSSTEKKETESAAAIEVYPKQIQKEKSLFSKQEEQVLDEGSFAYGLPDPVKNTVKATNTEDENSDSSSSYCLVSNVLSEYNSDSDDSALIEHDHD